MTSDVIIHEHADTRPPVPPMPTLYVCRYMEWKGNEPWYPPRWNAYTSMFARKTLQEAQDEYAELVGRGCRNVTIIEIPGDDKAAKEDDRGKA